MLLVSYFNEESTAVNIPQVRVPINIPNGVKSRDVTVNVTQKVSTTK